MTSGWHDPCLIGGHELNFLVESCYALVHNLPERGQPLNAQNWQLGWFVSCRRSHRSRALIDNPTVNHMPILSPKFSLAMRDRQTDRQTAPEKTNKWFATVTSSRCQRPTYHSHNVHSLNSFNPRILSGYEVIRKILYSVHTLWLTAIRPMQESSSIFVAWQSSRKKPLLTVPPMVNARSLKHPDTPGLCTF